MFPHMIKDDAGSYGEPARVTLQRQRVTSARGSIEKKKERNEEKEAWNQLKIMDWQRWKDP